MTKTVPNGSQSFDRLAGAVLMVVVQHRVGAVGGEVGMAEKNRS